MLAARIILFLIGLGFAGAADAQQNVLPVPNPLSRTNGDTAATITSTHGTVVAAGTYAFVDIANQSASATIYCVWGGTSVASATAGQRTISPLAEFIWDYSNAPPNKVLDCVCSAASCPATLVVY
jgi:hypothetical protein